ncbi:MAG: hypothetical protein HJJLKODD_01141 [Phycisphaerae bacterium]|nr:hypothetical protein [Phycisphaerae bacterium]
MKWINFAVILLSLLPPIGCNSESSTEEASTVEQRPVTEDNNTDSDFGVGRQDTSEQTAQMVEQLDAQLDLLPLERSLAVARIKLSFAQKELEYQQRRVELLEKEESTSDWSLMRARWQLADAEDAVNSYGDDVSEAERDLQRAQGISPNSDDEHASEKWW